MENKNNKMSKDFKSIFTKIVASMLAVLMVLAVSTTVVYCLIAG